MILDKAYKTVFAKLNLKPRIEVIIFNTDNEILVGKNPRNGHYMFPGGKIEIDESPLEAARRELMEEAGMGVSHLKLVGYQPIIHGEYTTLFASGFSYGEKEDIADDFLQELTFMDKDDIAFLMRKNCIDPDFEGLVEGRIDAMNIAYNELFNIKKGALRPRVEVIVFDKDNKVLLGKNPRWGHWSYPGGGIDESESPFEAAKRETMEETGVSIKPLKILNKEPIIFNYDSPKKDGYTGSATTFVLAKATNGSTTEEFGADKDIMKNISFRSINDARSKMLSSMRPETHDLNNMRLSVLNKTAEIIYENSNICINELHPLANRNFSQGDTLDPLLAKFAKYSLNANAYSTSDGHIKAASKIDKGDPIYVSMKFPKEELDDLHLRNSIYTTRIENEKDKYSIGEIVSFNKKKWLIDEINKYNSLEEHPFLNYLTDKQKELIKNKPYSLIHMKQAEYGEPQKELLGIPQDDELNTQYGYIVDEEPYENDIKDYLIKESAIKSLETYSLIKESGSIVATAGQHIFNSYLPDDLKDYERVVTKGSLKKILQKVADKYPEKYAQISDGIRHLGDEASVFDLRHLRYNDLRPPVDVKPYLDKAKKQADILYKKYKNMDYALADAYGSVKEELSQATIQQGLKSDNLYSVMSGSGARGSSAQVADLVASPLLVSDYKNRPIPIIIDHSYAQGLTPAQSFAASYGTRRGMISVKLAVPEAGYFSKKTGWSLSSMVVTEPDCGTDNGVNYSIEDKWNIGKYLARKEGKYPKNTYIDKSVIEDLKSQGINKIMVRSPITCEAEQGLCQKCLGRTEVGKISPIGYNAGLNASAAMSEPLNQGMLSEKHTGGAIQKRSVGGFQLVSKLTSIPGIFPNKGILAQEHGKITSIEKAPWGGWKIYVGSVEHYTPEDNPPVVKEGDIVEKGDKLSEGIVNPAEMTKLKGIGDGRLSLAGSLEKALTDMKADLDRSHFEVASRAFINFGEAQEKVGDYFPGNIGRLDAMKKYIEYRHTEKVPIRSVTPFNIYLAKQVMHYFPGTEITEKVKKNIIEAGISEVTVTKEKPKVTPLMVRAEDTTLYDRDWVNRLSSQGLKKSLLEGVHRGDSSSTESNTSFVHPFVYGITFGKRKIY